MLNSNIVDFFSGISIFSSNIFIFSGNVFDFLLKFHQAYSVAPANPLLTLERYFAKLRGPHRIFHVADEVGHLL